MLLIIKFIIFTSLFAFWRKSLLLYEVANFWFNTSFFRLITTATRIAVHCSYRTSIRRWSITVTTLYETSIITITPNIVTVDLSIWPLIVRTIGCYCWFIWKIKELTQFTFMVTLKWECDNFVIYTLKGYNTCLCCKSIMEQWIGSWHTQKRKGRIIWKWCR